MGGGGGRRGKDTALYKIVSREVLEITYCYTHHVRCEKYAEFMVNTNSRRPSLMQS